MVRTNSTMLPLGTQAPGFALVNVDGQVCKLSDFEDAPALVVIFLCNHCPYVIHVADAISSFAKEYQARGVAVVGISTNDVSQYPQDSPEQMVHEAEARGYSFPYLFDEDQSVAKAYRAACTPDFFVFDRQQHLVYRGQFDDSRPKTDIPVTGADLRAAVDAVVAGRPVTSAQKPSLGCNIKWAAGAEPDYFEPAGPR